MAHIDLEKWSGSLCPTVNMKDVTPGDFTVLDNFLYDPTGVPIVRGGRRKWNSSQIMDGGSAAQVRGIFHFQQGSMGERRRDFVVVYAGTQVLVAGQDGVFTSILSGLESGLTPSFCSIRGWLIFASDSTSHQKPYYWDGASDTMKVLDSAPNCTLAAVHANRLWLVDQDEPSKLWFSAPLSPAVWDIVRGAGFLYAEPGDGNVISCLVPGWSGEMIIFKDGARGGATYRLQGLSQLQFTLTPLSTTIGAINPRAASLIGDRDLFFASRRGVHSLKRVFQFGDLQTSFIDDECSTFWRPLSDVQKLEAVCVDDYTSDSWWLFYDADGDRVNDTALVFNYRYDGVRGNPKISRVSYGAASSCVFREPLSGRMRQITGGYDGYTRIENTVDSDDDGTYYSWEARLHPIDAGDPQAMKAWREMFLRYDTWGTGDLNLSWWTDFRPSFSHKMSMNPARFQVPLGGDTREGEMAGIPQLRYPVHDIALIRQGGVRIFFKLSAERSRTILRGFRLSFDIGRPSRDSNEWFAYRGASNREIAT